MNVHYGAGPAGLAIARLAQRNRGMEYVICASEKRPPYPPDLAAETALVNTHVQRRRRASRVAAEARWKQPDGRWDTAERYCEACRTGAAVHWSGS